jgi:glycerophosphoryl diester phosphodiesterase
MSTSFILPPEQRPAWDKLAPMPVSRVSNRKPTIVGHRGASGMAPENTLAAFQAAVDLNIDGVEFDVQRSRDGHLIVFHDDDVDRTTDGHGAVYDLTLAELKALDAGSAFDARFRGERIPTLEETFELLRPTDLLLFVELKDPWRFPGMEEAVAELIRRYDLVERVQVRSFHHACLHTFFRIAPEIPLSELWFERLPGDDEVTFKVIDALHRLYTPENIAHIHQRGQLVTAWTVDDLDEARRLMDAGIDSLTSNHPNRLMTLFDT